MQYTSSQKAILRTLRYSAIFDAGLDIHDCYAWLHTTTSIPHQTFLADVVTLQKKKIIIQKGSHIGQTLKHVQNSIQRKEYSRQKRRQVLRHLSLISWIPWIDGVGITGSVAAKNARAEDDIDFIILTAKDRLWISRLIIIFILYPLRLLRVRSSHEYSNKWCCNLWLDAAGYLLPNRSLYIARELVQIDWIFSKGQAKKHFFLHNSWVQSKLANATLPKRVHIPRKSLVFPHIYRFFSALNRLAYTMQQLYMSSHRTRETVDLHRAFFHPKDREHTILKAYVASSGNKVEI